MSKNPYLAKKTIFPQLEGVIDVMLNLRETIKQISEKYDVDYDDLLEWVRREIDIKSVGDISFDDDQDE